MLTHPAIPLADGRGGVALCHMCQHRITFAGGYLEYLTRVLNAEISRSAFFRAQEKAIQSLSEGQSIKRYMRDQPDRYRRMVKSIADQNAWTLRLQISGGFASVTRLPKARGESND